VIAPIISRRLARAVLALALLVVCSATAHAQPKADVVRLANGDHITGEVKNLNRGQLELSTDDVGTLYFEWDKIVSLSALYSRLAARGYHVGSPLSLAGRLDEFATVGPH